MALCNSNFKSKYLIGPLRPPSDNSDNFSSSYLGYIILSGIPVLVFGLLDDLHFKVRPIYRLVGAVIPSIIAIVLLKTWLNRVDVLLIDGRRHQCF